MTRMDFTETGIIIAIILATGLALFYLIRYSNKRLLTITESLEEKIALQERASKKSNQELQALKGLFGKTNEGKQATQQGRIEEKAKEIERKVIEVMSETSK